MVHDIDLEKISLDISPQVLVSIAKIDFNGSEVDFNTIERFLKSDQGITSIVLRVANSKFFAHGKKVKTLKHAISILGFKMLRSLAMLAATRSLYGKNMYSRFKNYVWQPSISTALIAKEISLKMKQQNHSEECFTLGLLYKIGQVIFNILDKNQFIKVLNEFDKQEQKSIEIERDYFGTDHSEIGQKATSVWELPLVYSESIKYYKQLGKVQEEVTEANQNFVYILGISSYITDKLGLGYHPDASEEEFQIAIEALKIPEAYLSYFTEEYPNNIVHNADYKYYLSLL